MGIRSWTRSRIPGSDTLYAEIRLRWLARQTPRQVEDLLKSGSLVRLDLGGGDATKAGWLTIDIDQNSDLFWDLRRGIPFPDGTVDAIYSSHFLEHLSYHDGQAVLSEAKRVLKPSGTVSVCVPDARMYIDAYLGNRDLDPQRDYWEPAFVSSTGIDILNYVAYMDTEHKCMFDQEGLVERLNRAGFINARTRDFDPAIDLTDRQFESIYAEAEKG